MTPREKAESLVEVVDAGEGRYAARWKGYGDYVSPPDDFDGAEKRRRNAVDILEHILADAAGVTVQGCRYRLDPGREPWDQPRVRLADAVLGAGLALALGLFGGYVAGVYLPGAVWRALWPF